MIKSPYPQRFHALDNMRAVMMLLGVVLHSALGYATYTMGVTSVYKDSNNSLFLSCFTLLIHLFRMPVFFLVAGFFAAMLYKNLGAAEMLRNRVKRILIPLCVGWVLLFPMTILGAAFTVLGGPKGISTIIHQLHSRAVLKKNNLTFTDLLIQLGLFHLWFLYYLMLYYVAMVVLLWLYEKLMPDSRQNIAKAFSKLVTNPAGIWVFIAITFATMYNMPAANTTRAGFENSTALLPQMRVVLAYFVFFVFGWAIFKRQQLLQIFTQRAWALTILGVCLSALYGYLIVNKPSQHSHIIQIFLASAAIWLLSLGVTGLFVKYAQSPNLTMRYLTDASYWVYLFHLPLTLALPGLFIGIDIPGIIKFIFVFALTLFLSIITYHYWVRSSFIGEALNGKRYS